MKASIALSLLILAIGAGFGLHGHRELIEARVRHETLAARFSAAGLKLDAASERQGARSSKREREDKTAAAKEAAVRFVAFAKEMEKREQGEMPDADLQKKSLEFMDLMLSLDSSQLKILIAELKQATDLKEESRRGLIGFSIMTLASDHPEAALTLLTESRDLFQDDDMGKHVVATSLTKWCKDDPLAAMKWWRENSAKLPELAEERVKNGLLRGAAASDPRLAFRMVGELGFEDSSTAVNQIVEAADGPELRTVTLAALREHLSSMAEGKERDTLSKNAVSAMICDATREGYAGATRWFSDAGLSGEQLADAMVSGASYHFKPGETAQWLQWMGEKLPEAKMESSVRSTMENWTRSDYQAAGKWLLDAPEGPAKIASVRAYAETVAAYDPSTAAQWALTLPQGKARDQTLRNIYERWPRATEADKAAAEAFKAQQGLR